MKKLLALLLLVLVICSLLGFTVWYYWKNPLTQTVIINDRVIPVELAVTPREKERGLGYRDNLKEGHGMLFIYDHKEVFPFWMKGMRFPLDFVWIDGDKVVDITESVPLPEGEIIPTFHPRVPVDKILELNAGAVKQYEIHIGDIVKYSN